MPEDAAFCPACGLPMNADPSADRAQGSVGALPRRLAGALAYFTFIPAILFLLIEPYRRDRFVRFHSVQCLGAWVALLIIEAGLKILTSVLSIVPLLGHLLALLLAFAIALAFLVLWLVLVAKALQGESFKLPLLGDFAERQAGAAP
jgi:uncharacterized membrane protein